MTVTTSPDAGTVSFAGADVTVGCADGETILLAGLRAGLALPYECASGGCGTCRAQLLEGEVASRWEAATGLSVRDRRKGDRILLCQSVPTGPSRVRVPLGDRGLADEPIPARMPGRLVERDLLTGDTARFVIETAGPVPYLSGQFVLLEFADGVRRAYSMTRPSRPGHDHLLELLIRAKPGGAASRWLFDRLTPGSGLLVEGPYGKAYAQSPPGRPVVCLAGGTGLAPVLAIAEQLADESADRYLGIYVGARRLEDLVLAGRLRALADRGAHVVAVAEHDLGREHPQLGPVRAGLALDHLAEDLSELGGHDIYLAGPSPMIDATLRRLVREGTADADRIFFDRFIA